MNTPKYFCNDCGVSVDDDNGRLIIKDDNLELYCLACLTSLRGKGIKFKPWPSGEIKNGKVTWFDETER